MSLLKESVVGLSGALHFDRACVDRTEFFVDRRRSLLMHDHRPVMGHTRYRLVPGWVTDQFVDAGDDRCMPQ